MSVFTDEVEIRVRSGKGGDGIVSFRREKYVPKGGPDGGDGGDGGDIVFVADRRLKSLYNIKLGRFFKAENGRPGQSKNRTGARGKDCVLRVPVGTIIKKKETGEVIADLVEDGQRIVVLKGGRGGLGNTHFASPVNRAPRIAKPGEPGKEIELVVQLKLIADVGLVGLPNAGKSTLLSVLTKARPKIGNYPFTTLYPNLGVMEYKESIQVVIADIPGIIEGAHEGHGLGIRFLKHIERTGILLVLIDLTESDYIKTYSTIKKELESYSDSLVKKESIIVGSKADLVDSEVIKKFKNDFSDYNSIIISAVTGYNIEKLKDMIVKFLESKNE